MMNLLCNLRKGFSVRINKRWAATLSIIAINFSLYSPSGYSAPQITVGPFTCIFDASTVLEGNANVIGGTKEQSFQPTQCGGQSKFISTEAVFYTLTSTLGEAGLNYGDYRIYKVNEYLGVGASYTLHNDTDTIYAPSLVTNSGSCVWESAGACRPDGLVSEVPIANNRRLSLLFYIIRPFVGASDFSISKAFSVGLTTSSGVAGPIIYSYSIVGSINVPQSCVIDAGQVININFGNLSGKSFLAKGQKPDGFIPVEKTVSVKCSNIEAQSNLTMRLVATTDTDFPDAIASNKKGIGVVVTTDKDKVMVPNTYYENLPLPVVPLNKREGDFNFKAYPVKTSDGAVPLGDFTATGTLRVDFD
ncbi:fimbrial protein [Serratia proteamaculans]|uniref:Fimbrial protein n=1 Tax=Serratia proteamaculans TaxID=28151 RepID=A0A5Q2V927_SERPR|nr:fimbrial protein [Serratia proteamaculans]QGH60610.1 fimbrial protein [Serratia proteamaculans]